MDAVLLYTPLALLGGRPTMASHLTFLPTEDYTSTSLWLSPAVLFAQWLFRCAPLHLPGSTKGTLKMKSPWVRS
jgi:hypothetical protein